MYALIRGSAFSISTCKSWFVESIVGSHTSEREKGYRHGSRGEMMPQPSLMASENGIPRGRGSSYGRIVPRPGAGAWEGGGGNCSPLTYYCSSLPILGTVIFLHYKANRHTVIASFLLHYSSIVLIQSKKHLSMLHVHVQSSLCALYMC